MAFHSILYERPEHGIGGEEREAPAFFRDLNLDQVIQSITAGRDEYRLKPFFFAALPDVEAIEYRHEIFHDLEGKGTWECIRAFAQQMRAMRDYLAQTDKLYYTYQKESWFLDAVGIYVEAVRALRDGLAVADLASRGFLALREYLTEYLASPAYTSLVAESAQVREGLAQVTYCLHIQGSRITVSRYAEETDYAAEVEETFERFKRGAVKDYRTKFTNPPDMNHVEAGVLDLVAQLFPGAFQALDRFYGRHRDFVDRTIARFDRQVQFYVAYLDFVRRFTAAGLNFCYPRVSDRSKAVQAHDTFDLALANRLIPENATVVCNDFHLAGPERIFVVTGPNQGGKTTFARTVGQLHHLAGLGCLVPGSDAQLFLCDGLFTHFEREETLENLHGKLQDDLIRIHEILDQATPQSILILNEIFTSTTLRDALFLSKRVLERIVRLDLLCVCVTFLDELASLSGTVVSMVSMVAPEDPTIRTFKILRRPADGRAYAVAIAEKYGLTRARLRERLAR